MKYSGFAMIFLLMSWGAPAIANPFSDPLADAVKAETNMCTEGPEACAAGGVAIAVLGVLCESWHLHQVAELARHNYGYFNNDIQDMSKYLGNMEEYIGVYQRIIDAENYTELFAYSAEALANAKNFYRAVRSAITHERKARQPTWDPVYGLWCWAFGCPYVPKEVDDSLVAVRRDMSQIIPHLETLQRCSKNPESCGHSLFQNVQNELKSELSDVHKDVEDLKYEMTSDTRGGTALVAVSQLSLGSRPSGITDIGDLVSEASSVLEALAKQQSWSQKSLYSAGAMLIGGLAILCFMAYTMQCQGREVGSLADALLSGQRHYPDGTAGRRGRLVELLLGVLLVLILIAGVVSAWSWGSYLQLDNSIDQVNRLERLARALQADKDMMDRCRGSCDRAALEQGLASTLDHGAMAMQVVMDFAKEVLADSKLFA